MAFVGGVPVTLMRVVHVISMGERHVPAAIAMYVLVLIMSGVTGSDALVGMVVVHPMHVTVVHVIDMVVMRDGGVPAAETVHVAVAGMSLVIGSGSHRTFALRDFSTSRTICSPTIQ
jgi:hypothetical protein